MPLGHAFAGSVIGTAPCAEPAPTHDVCVSIPQLPLFGLLAGAC